MSAFVPKAKTVISVAGQIVAILAVVGPAFLWAYNTAVAAADVRAQAYIRLVVDQQTNAKFYGLAEQVKKLTESIDKLAAQTPEGQAAKDRQIACLKRVMVDPAAGTVEGCLALQ